MDSAETLTARWILLASEGSRLYQRSCWRNVEMIYRPLQYKRPCRLTTWTAVRASIVVVPV